ncbi:MAG: PilZ domain-containing protein [Deltaproteobacteria bacterium]|nr:PilZ domain-containing protein [Deltaproteobacteria bacterium]
MDEIRASLFLQGERLPLIGVTVDVSAIGALIRCARPAPVGAKGTIELATTPKVRVPIRVLRVDSVTYKPFHGIGVQFSHLTPEAREILHERSPWTVTDVPGGCQVQFRVGFTEATNFFGLLGQLKGNVAFDLSGVRQISSVGVKKWVHFVERLPAGSRVRYVRCSPQFVQQATMIRNFLGRGEVESVLVPYSCVECGATQEVLVEVHGGGIPQIDEELDCTCGGVLEVDVMQDVFFSFLVNA